MEPGLQMRAVRYIGQIENAESQHPCASIPLERRAGRVAPGIRRIVEGSGIDCRPVHKVISWIVGVLIVVEDVGHADLAERQHQPVRAASAAELQLRRVDPLSLFVEIHGLAYEHTVPPQVGVIFPHLVGLAARKPGEAEGVVEAESLVDFGGDPDFRARPQTPSQKKGHIHGFFVGVRGQTVLARVRSVEIGGLLLGVGELAMHGITFGVLRGAGRALHAGHGGSEQHGPGPGRAHL